MPFKPFVSVEVVWTSRFHSSHNGKILQEMWDAGLRNFAPVHPNVKFPPWAGWEKRWLEDIRYCKKYFSEGWNLAFVGGEQQMSGKKVIVVDLDRYNLYDYPFSHDTLRVATPSDGRHYYYYVDDETAKKVIEWGAKIDGVDVRYSGGYVIAPSGYINCCVRKTSTGEETIIKGGYPVLSERPIKIAELRL